jgi:hypothetical protein
VNPGVCRLATFVWSLAAVHSARHPGLGREQPPVWSWNVLDLEPAGADMPTLCSTAAQRTFVRLAVLRCRFKPSGSPVELTTQAGKVVVIEIGGVQPIKNVLQFALRPLVAFARSDIAIGGRRRHNRVGK